MGASSGSRERHQSPLSPPVGFDPEREEAALLARVHERKIISNYLVYCAARAFYRRANLPFWKFIGRWQSGWLGTAYVLAVEAIERGDCEGEQAAWLIDIDDGQMLTRSVASAIEARRAAATEIGSVHESAVAESETPTPSRKETP